MVNGTQPWHLNSVSVLDKATGMDTRFDCSSTLSVLHDELRVMPGAGPGAPGYYEKVFHTNDDGDRIPYWYDGSTSTWDEPTKYLVSDFEEVTDGESSGGSNESLDIPDDLSGGEFSDDDVF